MIFKNNKKLVSYIKLINVSHAGSLPGKTPGGKSHVLNITYRADQASAPSTGISDIILTISDTKSSIISPKIKFSSNAKTISDIQSLSANIRAANSNTKTSAYGKKVSNVSFAGNKNLNISFNLLDPFYSRSEKKENIGKFLNRKIDEKQGSAGYSGASSPKVAYGTRESIKLITPGKQSIQKKSKKSPGVSIRTEGSSARVLFTNNSIKGAANSDLESLTNAAGYPYSTDGQFNRAALGNQNQNVILDLGYYNKVPGSVDPMNTLIEQGTSTLSADRFATRSTNAGSGIEKVLYSDACYSSVTIDKIDPAKSALILPVVDTGISSTLGIKSSCSIQANIKSSSKKHISKSNNQTIIKNNCNTITRLEMRDYNDIPPAQSFPVISQEAASYATVSQLIPINSAYASSYNVIYANISVYTTAGKVVQDYDFEIPLGTILTESDIPIEPPLISSHASRNGIITLEIKQVDKKADGIEVYARPVTRDFQYSRESPWQKITDVQITSEQAAFFVDHKAETSSPIIYRAISKTKNRKSCNFGSTVNQAIDRFGKSLNTCIFSASLYSIINSKGSVEITATNIKGGPQSVCLLRKNLSLFEKDFTQVSFTNQAQFVNTGDSATFVDTTVQEGHLYEYTLSSMSFDGIKRINTTSTVLEYILPSGDVTLSVKNPTSLRGTSPMLSNVAIPVSTKMSTDQDAYISKMINDSGIPKDKIDKVSDLAEKASQITGVLITRLNETTGQSAYLGFFPSGGSDGKEASVFIDKGDRASNIPSPAIGSKYRYIFEAVLGNLNSIVDDAAFREELLGRSASSDVSSAASQIKLQKARDKNDLTFTNDASSGMTPDPLNPNRPEKFFNSRTLGRGRDAGTLVLPKPSTAQEIESGRTGRYASVFIDLSDTSTPTVTKASCRIRSDGNVMIEWSVKDNKNIDHFLIQETRYGNSSVSIAAHNNPHKGKYSIIDPFARSRPGSVSYSVIPVDINYRKGDPFSAGSITIYPEDLHAVSVSKDLPDPLSTSTAGSHQYPEI